MSPEKPSFEKLVPLDTNAKIVRWLNRKGMSKHIDPNDLLKMNLWTFTNEYVSRLKTGTTKLKEIKIVDTSQEDPDRTGHPRNRTIVVKSYNAYVNESKSRAWVDADVKRAMHMIVGFDHLKFLDASI